MLPEGETLMEAVIGPGGKVVAVQVVSSTVDQSDEWGRQLEANALVVLRGSKYEKTVVDGVGAYVCLPVAVRYSNR